MNEITNRDNQDHPEPRLEQQDPKGAPPEIVPAQNALHIEAGGEPKVEAEMPEDLVEPEGKSGKWKTVKGEVEVEGKKVEVSYREKVIELPKHRQEETGIKRIRRRELLPPFPERLYVSSDELRSRALKRLSLPDQYRKELESGGTYYSSYNSNKKFDDLYNFLTDGKYPAPRNDKWAHIVDYNILSRPAGTMLYEERDIKRFKKENLYFQKIYHTEEKDEKGIGRHYDEHVLYCWAGRMIPNTLYATPVFVFGNNNKNFIDYLSNLFGRNIKIGASAKGGEVDFKLLNPEKQKERGVKPLRWCHAELALVPTKRSLNVLFFETGDEDKPASAKGYGEAKEK